MVILASWDDGSLADMRMAELMSKYNIPTTFYWPVLIGSKNTGNNVSWLTPDNCKEIADSFTIGSHSHSHQAMNKMSVPQLAMEITDSRSYWQNFTGQTIESFAYPKNSVNSLIKALIKGAGYKSARSMIPGFLHSGEEFLMNCTVQVGIDRIEYNNKSWELFADEMLEKSSSDSIFHIFGNSWEVDLYNDWDNLENLLKRLYVGKI